MAICNIVLESAERGEEEVLYLRRRMVVVVVPSMIFTKLFPTMK